MAAATPWLLSAAARRWCTARSSASTIGRREVTDSHTLTIDGCETLKKIPRACFSKSEAFAAAGHTWRIWFFPRQAERSWSWRQGYLSLYLELNNGGACYRPGTDTTDPVDFKFTLLDLAGDPVPRYSRTMAAHVFTAAGEEPSYDRRRVAGFNDFIRWKDLETSGCLHDDRFTVRCDITVFHDYLTADNDNDDGDNGALHHQVPVPHPPAAAVTVPPSNLREHLGDLLLGKKKKQGADVTLDVAGESFEAHGWLLAARSPVFEAELLAAAARRRAAVAVQGVDPKVFRAMLHYMYTDELVLPPEPETKEEEFVAAAQGLLAAAHRYKIERLKRMCEDALCRKVGVGTAASSLAVAEQHGCRALKAACLEFMARPGNLRAVMETEGFEKMKATCPDVMLDLIMEQVAARMDSHA